MHFILGVIYITILVAGIFLFFLLVLKIYKKLTFGSYKSDQDMTGKTVLITGATAGIGKFTAYDLAKRKARVILACRNLEKAQKVADEIKKSTGNQDVVVKLLDLSSFKSVRQCAQDILESEEELHVLINNAGILSSEERAISEDGCEMVMQSNFLGHFLLTLLLFKLLRNSAPSRIINVASSLHRYATMSHQNINLSEQKGYRSMNLYGNSNLARILFTRELAERILGTGVTVNTLHPGFVYTDIFYSEPSISKRIGAISIRLAGKDVEQGSQTTIRLAVDPSLEKVSGKYFKDCQETDPTNKAKDKELGRRLFQLSEQAVGEIFPPQN